jgi:hydroxymethylglutaryl-CoA reductase (NADPH)
VLPAVHGVHADPEREAYVILMERLTDDEYLKDTVDTPEAWTPSRIDAALRGIADVHAEWLGRERELLESDWIGELQTGARIIEMRGLWSALVAHNAAEHGDLVDASTAAWLRDAIDEIEHWRPELDALPQTLVHGDFNPRNIALRRGDDRLVAYDWELAAVHVPQRDLVELLAFVLPSDTDAATVERHVEAHRLALETAAGTPVPQASWRRGYELALWEFAVVRLQLYLMAHTHREYAFLERVTATVKRLLALERGER